MYRKITKDYTDLECRMFTELVTEMGAGFYQYMHGERKEPDTPETLMKRHLKFFDGDWMDCWILIYRWEYGLQSIFIMGPPAPPQTP